MHTLISNLDCFNSQLSKRFCLVPALLRVTLLDTVNDFMTCESNMMWRWNVHKSTSLTELQKSVEGHGCKSWVTNLSIVPLTLAIVTASITYRIVLLEYVNKFKVCLCVCVCDFVSLTVWGYCWNTYKFVPSDPLAGTCRLMPVLMQGC